MEDEDEEGGLSPINLPTEDIIDDEDEDEYAQEKIYNICSSGKKTHVTTTELYGFFMWILTAVAYVGYQFWAYVPEHIL